MNPHELARLPDQELSDLLLKSLQEKDFSSTRDTLIQIQTRFDRLSSTPDGCQQFLDAFLPLAGTREVRALHISDEAVETVARLEHLLELAGVRARTVSSEAVLRRIVGSRERGMDLLKVLAAAPQRGFSAGEIADRLGVSGPNLSPLLSVFHAYGLIDRRRAGQYFYSWLTHQGRALLPEAEPQPVAPQMDVKFMFLASPITGRKDLAA